MYTLKIYIWFFTNHFSGDYIGTKIDRPVHKTESKNISMKTLKDEIYLVPTINYDTYKDESAAKKRVIWYLKIFNHCTKPYKYSEHKLK